MSEISIPFGYETPKLEIKNFYISYLVRCFIIKGDINFSTKIYKKDFIKVMKSLGWDRKRCNRVWDEANSGLYIKYIDKNFLILNGKENIIQDRGFIIRHTPEKVFGYYEFCSFVTYVYTMRPVTQDKVFYDDFKFKKNNKEYNKEIFKRSLEKKKGRGQRRIASQSGCSLKTINNRLKKNKNIKILKRYDSYNGYKINKTNLYFSLENITFIYYMKNNNSLKRKYTLKTDHLSLINKRAIFLNGSKGLNKSDDTIYKYSNKLITCS